MRLFCPILSALFASLLCCAVAHAQTAVPAAPAIPGQARPAVPVTPDSITPPSAPAVTTTPAAQAQVAVSIIADSSLKQVIAALAQTWANAQDNAPTVPLTLANAGAVRARVEAGANADVVISADVADVKALTDKGLLSADGQRSLARNAVVIYGRKALLKDDDLDWFDQVGSEWKKIALGDPEVVASGRVAAHALKKHDLLDDDHKGLYIYAQTDALAVSMVQRDAVDAVFIYKTDAMRLSTPGFEIVPMKTDDAPPVFYVACISRQAKNPTLARAFIDYCGSAEAKAIWAKYGFETD